MYPELRLGKGLARARTDWETALEHAANVFAETISERPDSLAERVYQQLKDDIFDFRLCWQPDPQWW